MNLILLEQFELDQESHASLTGARAAHLRTVLRVGVGDSVRVGVVDGPLGIAIVTAIDGDDVNLACRFGQETPAVPPVDLLLAVPRPKVLRRLWPQLAALGVHQIILSNAERVERNYFDTHWLAPEAYRPLLLDGLQQARDTRLPQVSVHRQFRKLIEDDLEALAPSTLRLVAHPHTVMRVGDAVRGPTGRVLLAVGPEGGWNAFELRLLESHSFRPVSLGRRTLRSDTACVALLAIVHDALITS